MQRTDKKQKDKSELYKLLDEGLKEMKDNKVKPFRDVVNDIQKGLSEWGVEGLLWKKAVHKFGIMGKNKRKMIVLHLDDVNKNVWIKQGFIVEYGDKICKGHK